jgi:hypothetical protein
MFRFKFFVVMLAALLMFANTVTAQESGGESDINGNQRVVSGGMKITLKDKLELHGTPIDLEMIKMSSLIGDAKIPLHTIAGIRFAQGPEEQTTVVLLNGDAITGDIHLTDIEFVSEWGQAKVHVTQLVSVVFRDDLVWSGITTPNGKRWRLTKSQRKQRPGGNNYVYSQGWRGYMNNRR